MLQKASHEEMLLRHWQMLDLLLKQEQGREESSRAGVEEVKDGVEINFFAYLAKMNKVIYFKATSEDLGT